MGFWGHATSKNPCKDNYAGTHPFSEPETRAIKNAMFARISKGQRYLVYLTFHSFGQFLFVPPNFVIDTPPTRAEDLKFANAFRNAEPEHSKFRYYLQISIRPNAHLSAYLQMQ